MCDYIKMRAQRPASDILVDLTYYILYFSVAQLFLSVLS